jgi:hypothetical protein
MIVDDLFEELATTGYIERVGSLPYIQLYSDAPVPDSFNAVKWWQGKNAIRWDVLKDHCEVRQGYRLLRDKVGFLASVYLEAESETCTLVNFGRESKVYSCIIVPPWPFS